MIPSSFGSATSVRVANLLGAGLPKKARTAARYVCLCRGGGGGEGGERVQKQGVLLHVWQPDDIVSCVVAVPLLCPVTCKHLCWD